MTEEMDTKDLTDRELLELMRLEITMRFESVESQLAQVDGRLGSLEARTNPLPPNYDARFTALEGDVKELKREMKMLRKHDFQREVELNDVIERVEALEDRAA
jgi:hypothetical protein